MDQQYVNTRLTGDSQRAWPQHFIRLLPGPFNHTLLLQGDETGAEAPLISSGLTSELFILGPQKPSAFERTNVRRMLCTSFDCLSLEEQQFDLVICVSLTQYVSDFRRFSECLWRSLKPGGSLVFFDSPPPVRESVRTDGDLEQLRTRLNSARAGSDRGGRLTEELLCFIDPAYFATAPGSLVRDSSTVNADEYIKLLRREDEMLYAIGALPPGFRYFFGTRRDVSTGRPAGDHAAAKKRIQETIIVGDPPTVAPDPTLFATAPIVAAETSAGNAVLERGWYPPETIDGVTTYWMAREAAITLIAQRLCLVELGITFTSFKDKQNKLSIVRGGEVIAELLLSGVQRRTFYLSLLPGSNSLLLSTDGPLTSLSAEGRGPDGRPLTCAASKLSLRLLA